ncbi:MAG: hypothetical protein N2489_08560 [Clostridia bacterium]|nr:hypothetical protein [Clostridia bacterium]
MKVTFPHMGSLYIAIKVLLDTLNVEYVVPPFSINSLEAGIMNSPEFACLPFKLTLGNFISAIEQGADTVLFGGGCGQCRFGYYSDLHEEILRSMGYNARFICVNSSNMTPREVIQKLKPLAEGRKSRVILKSVLHAVRTILALDRLNGLACHIRCREAARGSTDKVMKEFHSSIERIKGFKAVAELVRSTRNKLRSIELNKVCSPLKIAIVGEIYTCTDPYINQEIERRLGNMGVDVDNKQTISRWVVDHGIKKLFPFEIKNKAHEAGKKYINTDDIGGHGLQTIGNCILSAKAKYDGAIQIYPFTCMPEIIAQNTFGEIQKDYGIPVLTLIIDEMTGEAGYMTRVEAFVDMLERKRKLNPLKKQHMAY